MANCHCVHVSLKQKAQVSVSLHVSDRYPNTPPHHKIGPICMPIPGMYILSQHPQPHPPEWVPLPPPSLPQPLSSHQPAKYLSHSPRQALPNPGPTCIWNTPHCPAGGVAHGRGCVLCGMLSNPPPFV